MPPLVNAASFACSRSTASRTSPIETVVAGMIVGESVADYCDSLANTPTEKSPLRVGLWPEDWVRTPPIV